MFSYPASPFFQIQSDFFSLQLPLLLHHHAALFLNSKIDIFLLQYIHIYSLQLFLRLFVSLSLHLKPSIEVMKGASEPDCQKRRGKMTTRKTTKISWMGEDDSAERK